MIARGKIATAPAPTPWRTRATISTAIDGASAQPIDASANSASPASITGLRPNRSASGPTASGAVEKPARKAAIAEAASAWLAPKSACTRPTLGSAMSVARAGKAESPPSNAVNPNPSSLSAIGSGRRVLHVGPILQHLDFLERHEAAAHHRIEGR